MADLIYSADNLTPSEPNNVNEVKAIKTETAAYVNGSGWVDSNRLAAGAVTGGKLATNAVGDSTEGAAAGLNGASTVRRGKSIIATEESTTSSSYTYLTTPDRVQNVVLPTDGLIFVAYTADWYRNGGSGASAALFVGANQAKIAVSDQSIPREQYAVARTGGYGKLLTTPGGLVSGSGAYSGDEATGQILGTAKSLSGSYESYAFTNVVTAPSMTGGVCTLFAAAGTYDIGIKFKASSGTVYAKERKLWVWTMGF